METGHGVPAFNATVQRDETADVIYQRITNALAQQAAYRVNAQPGLIVLTRRYRPGWATFLGVVGLLVFLVGVVFFFYKQTEALTITISPRAEGGCSVTFSGQAHEQTMLRLQTALAGAPF